MAAHNGNRNRNLAARLSVEGFPAGPRKFQDKQSHPGQRKIQRHCWPAGCCRLQRSPSGLVPVGRRKRGLDRPTLSSTSSSTRRAQRSGRC